MDDILTDLSEPILGTAIKANLYAFFRFLGHSSQAEFHESAALMRWHTPVAHPWFNGVLSKEPGAGNDERTIQETVSYFTSRNVTSFTWWPDAGVAASALHSRLVSHGFRYDADTPGMAVALDALPQSIQQPDALVIRQVTDSETLGTWAQAFIEGYELPGALATPFFELIMRLGFDLPIRCYLGYVHDRPVATSMLFLAAGVAGIYSVATIPEARRQGAGTYVTLAPMQEARAMGYRVGVLQTSTLGRGVYERLGFRQRCVVEHFYWEAG